MYIQHIQEKGKDNCSQSVTTFPNHKAIAQMNLLKQRQTGTKPYAESQNQNDEQDSLLAAAIMSMCINGTAINHSSAILLLIMSLII